MARLEKSRTKEWSSAHSSMYHKEATHNPVSYSPQHSKKSTPFLSSSPTSVHPSSFKPKPVARTVSCDSNLFLQTGSLYREDDQQQYQPPPKPARVSNISPLTSTPSFPTLSSSSSSSNFISRTPHHRKQSTQHYTKGSMDRVGHEETMAYSRTVDSLAGNKIPDASPLLTIDAPPAAGSIPAQKPTPPSLSPSSRTPTTSYPSECSSSESSCADSGTALATAAAKASFVISQPVSPFYAVPADPMVIQSTPPCASTSVANGAAAGASTSLLPLAGHDYVNYSSLSTTHATSVAVVETTSRPWTSMHAESWLSTVSPSSSSAHPLCSLPTEDCPEDNSSSCPMVPRDREQIGCVTVTRISVDQQSIHPLDPDYIEDCVEPPIPLPKDAIFTSASSENGPCLSIHLQPQQQLALRKKSSFAAKLRKVFVSKQSMSRDCIDTQEAIQPSTRQLDNGTLHVHRLGKSHLDQHRGSVSSISSSDTAPGHLIIRRGSNQTVTPSTSPESSPLNSPTIKANSPLRHSPSFTPLSALDAENAANVKDSGSVLPKSEQPVPTRMLKKRLSFASISSFFGTRNLQERRAKQPRSSSLPHVENPLVIVGRQIAGFQRRHSLNDLHEGPNPKENNSSVHHVSPQPWERECTTPHSPITAESSPRPPMKKLSLNNVFRQKKKSASIPVPLPPKPLKSALVHRTSAPTAAKVHHVHSVSRRRSASVRSQGSSHRRRLSQHRPQQRPTSRPRPNSDDPFARLAEANQALASLSRQDLVGHRDDYDALQSLEAEEYCSSPVSCEGSDQAFLNQVLHDNPQSPTRQSVKDMSTGSSAFSTPPTPRVLPISTRQNGSPAKASRFGTSPYNSPPPNPLSTLSRSSDSSCYSFVSGSEDVQGDFVVYHSRSSSVSDGASSCSSSSCSMHFDGALASMSSDQAMVTAASNTLLPASAARVSVDRITMEASAVGRANYESHYDHRVANPSYPTITSGYSKQNQWQQQHPTYQEYSEPQFHEYYYVESPNYQRRPRRQIQFSTEQPIVFATWTPEQYDRTSDPNITATRLTPAIAQKIKTELNQFKKQEMEVHQDSQVYTHFFI
ncbi:hypothetical protein B0O80DRAFT_436684 [Mortierella sp. GBAus27b]|nr:hypothetical protein B0O80DRAFT_436684 [Mortierella sp. GBAus27b]